jgi:hypothetical protein
MTLDQRDAEHLLRQAEFLRFLGAAIHAAGIVGQQVGADGHLTRDLSFLEGAAAWGSNCCTWPTPASPTIRASDAGLTTLTAARQSQLKDKPNDRRRTRNDRYADIPDSDA